MHLLGQLFGKIVRSITPLSFERYRRFFRGTTLRSPASNEDDIVGQDHNNTIVRPASSVTFGPVSVVKKLIVGF
jgi:hypothetical protein